MNKIKRFVSLALVLCMVMAFLPVGPTKQSLGDALGFFQITG